MDEEPVSPSDRSVVFSSICSLGPPLRCGLEGASLLRSGWGEVSRLRRQRWLAILKATNPVSRLEGVNGPRPRHPETQSAGGREHRYQAIATLWDLAADDFNHSQQSRDEVCSVRLDVEKVQRGHGCRLHEKRINEVTVGVAKTHDMSRLRFVRRRFEDRKQVGVRSEFCREPVVGTTLRRELPGQVMLIGIRTHVMYSRKDQTNDLLATDILFANR